MATALEACFEMLGREITPNSLPERSMRLAILTLNTYEERRAFLDTFVNHYEQAIIRGIRKDILSPYVISRLKKSRPIRDIAKEIASYNLSLAARKISNICPSCSQEWYDFLENC